MLRRALSPEHFHLGKHDKKTDFRTRKTSREERAPLGRQDSFELKGRHHRKHDTIYQGVRCVLEQESFVERARSVSLNETKTQNKLELKCELRRHSEEAPKTFLNLKSEPKDSSEERLEETEHDTKLDETEHDTKSEGTKVDTKLEETEQDTKLEETEQDTKLEETEHDTKL